MSLDSAPHPLEVGRNQLNYTFQCRDIEYAYPKRSGLASDRHSNPLNPDYRLGASFAAPPAPAPVAPKADGPYPTGRDISVADIDGTAPLPFYDKSKAPSRTPPRPHSTAAADCPPCHLPPPTALLVMAVWSQHKWQAPRDIMDWSDVSGSKPRQPSWRNRSGLLKEGDMMNSSLFVRDINVEGMFSSQRQTDPLEPHYEYDARQLAPKDLMAARPRPRTKESACLRTSDIEGAKPFSWNDIWAKQGDAPMRVTNYISDIDGTKPGQVAGRSNPHPELPAEEMNALGTFRQTNPLNPGYVQLDGEQPPESQHFTDPTHPAFPFNTVPTQTPKPSRLPPMEGEVFPQLQPPPPEPLQVEELDERQKARQAKKVLDFVRDKVEAKSKTMQKVFRQFDENKDGDISYDEFRMGLRHLGVDLSDGDYAMLVAKVDVDGEGTVDYNEFAEVLKAPDMQLSFMPTESPFASGQESQMKTDASLRRKGAFDGNKRKQMGLAMLPKDDILRQIAEKVEAKSKNLRNVFREFDEDKSGSVDLVEFRRGLAHLGFEMTDKQFDALLDRVDRDGNGDINYTEFAARLKGQDQQVGGIGGIGVSDWEAEQETIAARALEEADPSMGLGLGSEERKLLDEIADKVESKSKYIRKVFRDFDEDFDGTVNHKEFRNGLSHLGVDLDDKRFAMLLKLVDADGSGSVDYGEFANSLKGQDMQVGMLPADAAAKQAAAAALNPTRPADPSQLSAAPKAKLVGLEGPAPKAPSSSGSCRSNASEKRAARHLAERQAEIDAVRDL